ETGAVLTGVVLSAGKRDPVNGADVSLPALALGARTNAAGAFRIVDIPAGAYQVSVRQLGYAPVEVQVLFSANASITKDFVLQATQLLDSVVVAARRPSLPQFEERR